MRGGMKVYAGPPAAARAYLEVDRGRADDYYLAEGTGLARRFVARDGRVQELSPLAGDGYEAWVAGRDPDTGEPRGRLRTDDRAVRFVEVVVNGPKSWSLAAAVGLQIRPGGRRLAGVHLHSAMHFQRAPTMTIRSPLETAMGPAKRGPDYPYW